jgi:V/A-type H+/Na+-transporting ATPase subunit E
MPIDELVERIVGDASRHAGEIVKDARREAERTGAEAERKAEKEYERRLAAARQSAENERGRRIAIASLEARRSVLEEKQKLVREVLDRAMERLMAMPDNAYLDLMEELLVGAAGDGGGELIMSGRDRERLGRQLEQRANRRLVEEGKSGRVSLSDATRPISRGFIFRYGGIEINYSMESQIEMRAEELEVAIVDVLFGSAGND